MTVVFVLLPLAVVLAAAFVAMFIWATRNGQFDDVRTPQLRILFEEDPVTQAEAPLRGGSGEKERS